MLTSQTTLMSLCDELAAIARENGLPEAFSENALALKAEIENRQLVVPVVGAFSAGKSTLLNNCLGRQILPEAVTPETALATELHYSPEEYIEAVEKGGKTTRFSLDEMETLKKDAARFQYARAFLKSPALREIEPLILVDMPGFDSPLDNHNKAILAYLSRGAYYIVLSSGAEEKTPSASLLRRLREIETMERRFSFYVSKTNMLGSGAEIDAILRHYKTVLERELKHNVDITPLGDASGSDVIALLKSIDADALIAEMYRGRLKALCDELVELFDVRIAASQKSAEENRALALEMEHSIAKIEEKAAQMVADIEDRYASVAVNDVVQAVGRDLDDSLDELVIAGRGGNKDAVGQALNEVVRASLTQAFKSKLGRLVNDISMDMSVELSGLGSMMKGYGSDGNYVDTFLQKAQTLLSDLRTPEDEDYGEDVSGDSGSGKRGGNMLQNGYKVVTTVLSLISGGVITGLEAVIIFLPEILGPIGDWIQKKKAESDLRNTLQTVTFPAVKRKIRGELPGFLNGAVEKLINEVRAQYTSRIEDQRAGVSASIEAAKTGAEEQQKTQENLTLARNKALKLTKKILEN